MKNRIEEKIQRFITETEVSNVVAPELNVDRDRDEWLRQGGLKEQTAGAFDTTTAEQSAEKIKKGIKAPVVGVDVSRLGGDKNVSILIVVSLQPKNKWANGILENSPYMRFHFYNNGRLEQFSGGVRGKKPMRRTVAKNADDAVAKINKYIQSLGKVTDAYNPVEDLGNYMKKKKYGFSPGEGPIPTTVSTPTEGVHADSQTQISDYLYNLGVKEDDIDELFDTLDAQRIDVALPKWLSRHKNVNANELKMKLRKVGYK